MARKTADILKLIKLVNERNATSTCDPKVREGWNSLLESILHEAGVYVGFGYLYQKNLRESAASSPPGIEFMRQIFDYPGPCDEVVEPREFFAALDAENKERRENGSKQVFEPAGMYRRFPDESRRYYYVHAKLSHQ